MIETSGMFNKIKSLFVVQEPGNPKAAENAETIGSQVAKPEHKPVSAPAGGLATSDGMPDPKFTELLLKSIEANNIEGFDYLEYKNSLSSIAKVIPDEGMRYKSAFEMAKTMGLTKEKLIQSASHYIDVLTSEDKKFKDALQNQKAKQIQGRADQLAAIEKSIQDKQQMIEKLSKEIEASKAQLGEVKKEIDGAIVKIDVTNQQFVSSYNLVYNQIYEDIEKIKKNI
ncbi:MAG: hypothetical protein IPL08_10250 [Saprospiraceae bacterium]|nr:hypothetical protein [Saprospiraceae bacterium]